MLLFFKEEDTLPTMIYNENRPPYLAEDTTSIR